MLVCAIPVFFISVKRLASSVKDKEKILGYKDTKILSTFSFMNMLKRKLKNRFLSLNLQISQYPSISLFPLHASRFTLALHPVVKASVLTGLGLFVISEISDLVSFRLGIQLQLPRNLYLPIVF